MPFMTVFAYIQTDKQPMPDKSQTRMAKVNREEIAIR